MSKIVGVLFPWRKTFKRLDLEKRWWQRLAVVLFSLALVIAFWFSLALGDDAYSPVHSFQQDINYWEILPPPPDGSVIDTSNQPTPTTDPPDASSFDRRKIAAPLSAPLALGGQVSSQYLRKTIQMPNGTTATYPGTKPDEAIKADWQRQLKTATHKALILGFVVAVLVTLAFSYLLQASYRALLYVIYGAKAGDQ
jgi:hypothetical protein